MNGSIELKTTANASVKALTFSPDGSYSVAYLNGSSEDAAGSPPYWEREYFGFNLGKGLFWDGARWSVGNWTITDWTPSLCQYYQGLVLNAEQALYCYNASQAYFPLAGSSGEGGVFNFTACDLPYAIKYKNPENSYPEGAYPALYFLLYDDGSILQKYSSGNCYFSPVRHVRESELSVITWIQQVDNLSVEFRKEWSPNYLPFN